MNEKTPGYLVETATGNIGRTYHSKGKIKGKIPVYLATEFDDKNELKIKIATKFSETAILMNPILVRQIGFID